MKFSAYLRTCVVLLPGLLAGFPASAAVDGTPATVVTNLRVESNYGFIGFAQAIPSCGERVWVDVTTPLGRSVYSPAMMAFAMGKSVVIRADNASTRIFGACNIYDIYVAQ